MKRAVTLVVKYAWPMGGVVLLCLAGASVARATDQFDISTGLKTIYLLKEKIPMPVTVGVVYDAANEQSQNDAIVVKDNIDKSVGVPGGMTAVAKLVKNSDLTSLTGVKVIFVTQGLSTEMLLETNHAAATAGILSISTDLTCAASNKCVLGIVSKPRVEIYYSTVAAEASHIGFVPAFIMLAKPVGETK